ncbi:hypothetical protein SAMN05421821_101336 [Mucilaginibacter lappiensis]|uniref:Uncharacterized protein n=1 Tax=Mucilaginibacter lappiensis TaxID=354630 RepID=A0ABR6PDA9_9SPHI|nr:hypothetical protein [Mucilaginibacter lappiensis]MBB6107749.1 hypothetical protein [Mucilaginibacter lappiensis]SIP98339.1 hypothetical protein SAMN05421821_101336 [Mucilaginibacter lappiensis]
MLQDELKSLAEWAAGFSLTNTGGDPLPSASLAEQSSGYKSECIRIKKVWTDLLLSQTKDIVIKRYISFQQQLICELADHMYGLTTSGKPANASVDGSGTDLAASLLTCVLDLHDFLIQYFRSYINENGKIPNAILPATRKKIAEPAVDLSTALQTAEMDIDLKTCILDYLSRLAGTDYLPPGTYREMEYVLTFMENLQTVIAIGGAEDLTHDVTEMLFYINFNHSSFIHWYREDLERKKALLQAADQTALLMKGLLQLKSAPVATTMQYDPHLPPVNVLLETCLAEYIRQLNFQGEFSDPEQTDKLELKLTVAQMALLTRLLYDEGIFPLKNIKAILKFFTLHFTSKKQEHISYASMNKLYYSADQFTAYAVRELLLSMVANINKMHFPT